MGRYVQQKLIPSRVVIREFESFSPKFVALAEYDYTQADEGEFQQTFVADPERNELYRNGGDIRGCFIFHAKRGKTAYQEALVENRYQINEEGVGQGFARHKFF